MIDPGFTCTRIPLCFPLELFHYVHTCSRGHRAILPDSPDLMPGLDCPEPPFRPEIPTMSETPDQGDYQPGHQPPTPPESDGDQSGGPFWEQQSAAPGFGQQDAYGQGSPYGQPTAELAADPSPVLVSIGPAELQNRLTVAFRLIMAIPAGF